MCTIEVPVRAQASERSCVQVSISSLFLQFSDLIFGTFLTLIFFFSFYPSVSFLKCRFCFNNILFPNFIVDCVVFLSHNRSARSILARIPARLELRSSFSMVSMNLNIKPIALRQTHIIYYKHASISHPSLGG